MPRNSTVIILSTTLLVATSWFFHQPVRGQSDLKSLSLKPTHELLIRTNKLISPFVLSLTNPTLQPVQVGDRFTLLATLQTPRAFTNINYQWILPQGVELAPGYPLTGQFKNLTVNKDYTLSTEFLNSSSVNEKIHLRVWTDANNDKLIKTAQYNTLDQNKIDQDHNDIAARQNEYLDEHPELIKIHK